MAILKVTKDENRLLRWLQQAAATEEERPVLAGILVTESALITADGFRMHAAPGPACIAAIAANGGGMLKFGRIPAGAELVEAEPVEGRFPDLAAVMPTAAPAARLAVNAKYLREALDGLDGTVVLEVRVDYKGACTHPVEVLGHAADGSPRFALIMPMNISRAATGKYATSTWRPFSGNGNGENPQEE